jgi:hypothetical protein
MMNRENVASSNLLSIGYDDTTETLEVEFHGGAVYQYYNVPEAIYNALMAAQSKGQFLAYSIKNQYPYSRV